MAIFKLTWAFSGPDHGATESWYFYRPTQSVQDAFAFIDDLKDKRKVLLGAQWSMKAQRVALIKNNDGTNVTRVSKLSKFSLTSPISMPAAETNISLQVLCADSNQVFKKLTFLAGPWDIIFPFADSYDPSKGNWSTYFNAYASSLIAHNCGWMHAATTFQLPITGYTFSATTGHTTFTLAAPGFSWVAGVPVRVSVSFPLSKSPLDGTYLVVPIDNVLAITAKPMPASTFVVPGTMKIQAGTFVNLATTNGAGAPGTVEGENPMTRKRGRPLYVSRGRLPAKPVW